MLKVAAFGCQVLLGTVSAAAQMEEVNAEVILRVQSDGNIPVQVLAAAKNDAAAVLRTAGIKVRWERPGNHIRVTRDCSGAAIDVIDVRVLERGPKGDHPGALGYAMPFATSGVRVVIFYDRVAAMLPKPKPYLLGYAIAHEVGHMLIGTLSHADSGVMRPHWSGHDYSWMEAHLLSFTDGDIDMIRRHVGQMQRSCLTSGSLESSTEGHASEE